MEGIAARQHDEDVRSRAEAVAEPDPFLFNFGDHPPPPPRLALPTLPCAAEVARDERPGTPIEPAEPPRGAFDEAFEAGVEALLIKDYAAAYGSFERAGALRPEDSKTMTNLERLRQMGHGRS